MLTHYGRYMVPVTDYSDLRAGDIVVMRGPNYPNHVAFVAFRGGRMSLIHATVTDGKVVEDMVSDELRRMFIGAFRFKELV